MAPGASERASWASPVPADAGKRGTVTRGRDVLLKAPELFRTASPCGVQCSSPLSGEKREAPFRCQLRRQLTVLATQGSRRLGSSCGELRPCGSPISWPTPQTLKKRPEEKRAPPLRCTPIAAVGLRSVRIPSDTARAMIPGRRLLCRRLIDPLLPQSPYGCLLVVFLTEPAFFSPRKREARGAPRPRPSAMTAGLWIRPVPGDRLTPALSRHSASHSALPDASLRQTARRLALPATGSDLSHGPDGSGLGASACGRLGAVIAGMPPDR